MGYRLVFGNYVQNNLLVRGVKLIRLMSLRGTTLNFNEKLICPWGKKGSLISPEGDFSWFTPQNGIA